MQASRTFSLNEAFAGQNDTEVGSNKAIMRTPPWYYRVQMIVLHGSAGFYFKEQTMKRRFKLGRFIKNLFFLILSAILVFVIYVLGIFENLKHAIPLYTVLLIMLCGLPLFMGYGYKIIRKQDEIISLQVLHNQPIKFNRHAVIVGYLMMFSPLYALIFLTLLIPFDTLIWLALYIPFSVMNIAISKIRQTDISAFGMSVKKYKLYHLIAFLSCTCSGLLLRIFVVMPLLD